MLANFSFSDCLGLGASILKWHVCSSSRLGNCKNAKNAVLLMRNPYRLWSFQLGAQNMSKIGSFSENTVFYVTKLNHSVLHHFPGAWMLIWLLSCSSTAICTNVWELSAGNFRVKKSVELRTRNAQLPCNPNDYLQKTSYFTQYNYDGNPKIWLLDESSNGNECPWATWGRKLPWKWVYRGHLRRKR